MRPGVFQSGPQSRLLLMRVNRAFSSISSFLRVTACLYLHVWPKTTAHKSNLASANSEMLNRTSSKPEWDSQRFFTPHSALLQSAGWCLSDLTRRVYPAPAPPHTGFLESHFFSRGIGCQSQQTLIPVGRESFVGLEIVNFLNCWVLAS